jgi:hypothetical protein
LKKIVILLFLIAGPGLILNTQEEAGADWEEFIPDQEEVFLDIDSLFDNSTVEEIEEPEDGPISIRDRIMLEAAYGFLGGFAPGLSEAPWYNEPKEDSYIIGIKMEALLSMRFSLTDNFRVKNTFSFLVPDETVFSIKEFYFEYDFFNVAFLQAGLYEISWGISQFFPFTNLPARIPAKQSAGDAYTGRIKIPIGLGGLELLALTRHAFMSNTADPSFDELAYAMKYNLALEGIDIDTGAYYYKDLPFFFFVSLKTTLGNTELYTEGLAAVSHETWKEARFSGNAGFVHDFFRGKLTLLGEVFYNGELDSAWWRAKTEFLEQKPVDLYEGLNGALAFIIRPGIAGMRIFSQCLYSLERNSAWLVPGISITPVENFTISLSVPMALGDRCEDGDKTTYYRNNMDQKNRPFSILLGVNFKGKVRYTL